ncbi:MAG: peptidylprolyl isomerase [Pseudomonadota bacterium]
MKSLIAFLLLIFSLSAVTSHAEPVDAGRFGIGAGQSGGGALFKQGETIPIVGEQPEATEVTSEPVLLNRIIAIVNEDIIVMSELEQSMKSVTMQLQEKDTELPPQAVLEKQVLERLIMQDLQLQLAERNGVRIDDTMLNNKLQELARENDVTLSEFRDILKRDGFDYNAFRENLRKEMTIKQLRQQMVGSRLKVSDQEIDNLLANLKSLGQDNEQYHLAHILVAVPEAASPDEIEAAGQRASEVLAKLHSGADFSRTAIAVSDGTTALDGGDIGWRSIGQMPTLFVEPLESMQTGDVSSLLRSPGGFHIIKLLEKRGEKRTIVKQTKARHILLKEDALNTEAQNRIRIDQLAQRLRGGDDFATLARANSQDTLSAARGGDIGWVSPGELVPQFEEAMDALQPGEISIPVKTRYGWHIIQVIERRDYDSTEEFKRSRARQLIRSRKADEETFLWLRRLRDESYVEYRLES